MKELNNSRPNILYIHGFASRFKPDSEKVYGLRQVGPVYGVNLDYSQPVAQVEKNIVQAVQKYDINLLAGTSLGGYWAARIGSQYGIPFVAMNPTVAPHESLKKHIGKGETYFGEPFELKTEIVDQYDPISKEGYGLILLDRGDEVLDSAQTDQLLNSYYEVITFEGGNHRFAHITESIEAIKRFYNSALMTYGLRDD